MRSTRAVLVFIFLLLIPLTHSHKRGQEFTYMSMFMKPQTRDMVEGDNHLGKVYEQLSVHMPNSPQLHTKLSIDGNFEEDEQHEEDEEEEEEEIEEPSQDTQKDAQENNTSSNSKLNRASLLDNKKIKTKVSPHYLDQEEEEEEEFDDDHDAMLIRSSIPSHMQRGKRSVEHAENEQTHQGERLSKKLAKQYGEDLDRIQKMLLKVIRQYDIESMADIPCRAHAHWIPKFLEMVAAEKKNFQYYCVDTRKDVLKSVKESVGTLAKSKFILRSFWKQGIPRADLVFSWAGLDNMRSENVLKYLIRLSKTGNKHKIIAIGSHSGALKKNGTKDIIARFTAGGRPINVREKPFHLKRPMRIIGKLSTGGNDKQLYIYKAGDMMD